MFKFIGEFVPFVLFDVPLEDDDVGTICNDCGEGTIMFDIIKLLLFRLFIDDDRDGSVKPLLIFIVISIFIFTLTHTRFSCCLYTN